MQIRNFLRRNHLTVVWLREQLVKRGYDPEISHLHRIIDGERNSDEALEIRREAEAICQKYSNL